MIQIKRNDEQWCVLIQIILDILWASWTWLTFHIQVHRVCIQAEGDQLWMIRSSTNRHLNYEHLEFFNRSLEQS